MNSSSEKAIGVVLLNMGGPATLAQVRPYLRALFSDRELVSFPGGPLLQPVWSRLISTLRTKKVQRYYAEIGGGSPLGRLTEKQAQSLAHELNQSGRGKFLVEVAMRYTSPHASEAISKLAAAGASQLIGLPLYPHFCRATSGSSLSDLAAALTNAHCALPLTRINDFHDHPAYIEALSSGLASTLSSLPPETIVVFSAHSVPQKMIDQGDPYLEQIKTTVARVVKHLNLPQHHLAFQSRTGPVRWLEPDVHKIIDELSAHKVRDVVIVPISFVSDHIETLHELDVRLAAYCQQRKVNYHRAPALNDQRLFIQALAQVVLEHV